MRSWHTGGLERLNRERLGISEEEHAQRLDVDTTRDNWKSMLAETAASADYVLSVCTGSAVLAAAGLLVPGR